MYYHSIFDWSRANSIYSSDSTGDEYRRDNLILGLDTEKVLEAGFTGPNSRVGELMTVMCNYKSLDVTIGPVDAQIITPRFVDRMHGVLHADQILQLQRLE